MTTIASLFSGGGGADLGAIAAGFTPLWAVEHDAAIADVYRTNIGPHVIVADVAAVDYSILPSPDLLHASPVCTNASQAKSGGSESALDMASAEAVCRALRELLPRWFVLENVIPYRSFASYHRICSTLTDLGYIWHAEHCNASDYAVPQTRRRLILRASRDGLLRELPQAEPWVGWFSAIEDLIPTLPASRFAPWQLARLPAELTGTFLVRSQNSQQEGSNQVRYEDDPAMAITAGEKPRAFLADHANSNALRESHEPAHALTAQSDSRTRAWLDTGRVVSMTPRALATFQSFPRSYVLPLKNRLACQIIGNACPPLMMQRIAESLT